MYKIEFNHFNDVKILEWCREQFGPNLISDRAFGNGWRRQVEVVANDRYGNGSRIVEYIVFDREQDAILFALRWA